MKKLLFLLLPLLTFGNMANPWVDGSRHSNLYGTLNCKVLHEDLHIKIEKDENYFHSKFRVKYIIESKVKQTTDLLFIGLDLKEKKQILVNGKIVEIKDFDTNNASKVYYSEKESVNVNDEHLLYFVANLEKGKNEIIVEYLAHLDIYTLGFLKEYNLKYSLYPSKFWDSFGDIDIVIQFDEKLEMISSNIGKFQIKNNFAKLKLQSIPVDKMELQFKIKPNVLAKILIYISPFGISNICLIFLFIIHLILIKKKHLYQTKKYKYVLLIGNIIIPILYYFIYFYAYDLIDFTLSQERSIHGYSFLFIFTLPILMFVYTAITILIDRKLLQNKT